MDAHTIAALLKENRKLKRELDFVQITLNRVQAYSDAQARIETLINASHARDMQHFYFMLENINTIFFLLDAEDKFVYTSSLFLKVIETDSYKKIRNRHYKEILAEHLSEKHMEWYANFITRVKDEKNGILRRFEMLVPALDAQPRTFTVQITPMLDKNGQVNGVITLLNDITLINNAKLKAEEANRIKTAFLATMSHEIRTPLNVILGIAQIEMQDRDMPERYNSAFRKIHSSGNLLLGIINDILDLSKVETGKLELKPAEYDVPGFINDAAQLNIVRVGEKDVSFILEVDETLPMALYGDVLSLKQILNNLLSNAIKYTDEGYVKLSVGHVCRDDNMYLRFIIEDTGQGISEEDRTRLFNEYVRFNENKNQTTEGTGIGLMIVKHLVEKMEGTVDVSSHYNRGSIFTVEVKQKIIDYTPIGAELAGRLQAFTYVDEKQFEMYSIQRAPMPYGRALVVDDVEINLYVAVGMLTPYGIETEIVTSGFAAIEKIKNGAKYDIILMDHMMPMMDGIETVRRLRGMGYTGAVLALTANALAGNDRMFTENGFDGFIPKPIDIRVMDDVLNKYVRKDNGAV